MSEVRMSLEEYNQMQHELHMYKEVVEAITVPTVSDWDLKWWRDHIDNKLKVSSEPVIPNLSRESKKLLESLISFHVDEFIKESGIEGEFEFDPTKIDLSLGNIIKIKNNEEES